MKRFKNILCVVSAGSNGSAELRRAVELADNNQANMTVIEIIDEIPPNTKLLDRALSSVDLQAVMVEKHRQRLEEMVTSLSHHVEIKIKVLCGIPFLEIIKEVLRNGRDLVIKTAESGGLMDRIFGSDDMHLLRKCPCPVWLVKPEASKTYQRILAAVDVDDNYLLEEQNKRQLLNLQILEMASSLALSEFAELHIIHVWDAIGEGAMRAGFIQRPESEITTYIEEVRQQNSQNLNVLVDKMVGNLGQNTREYLKPKTHLLKGSPNKEIPAFASENKVDLVVMGTVGRTGISGLFMGNTAETILNKLDCSVLAIKPPGFETPVVVEN